MHAISSKIYMSQVLIKDKNPKPTEIRQGPLSEIFTDLFAQTMKA